MDIKIVFPERASQWVIPEENMYYESAGVADTLLHTVVWTVCRDCKFGVYEKCDE